MAYLVKNHISLLPGFIRKNTVPISYIFGSAHYPRAMGRMSQDHSSPKVFFAIQKPDLQTMLDFKRNFLDYAVVFEKDERFEDTFELASRNTSGSHSVVQLDRDEREAEFFSVDKQNQLSMKYHLDESGTWLSFNEALKHDGYALLYHDDGFYRRILTESVPGRVKAYPDIKSAHVARKSYAVHGLDDEIHLLKLSELEKYSSLFNSPY